MHFFLNRLKAVYVYPEWIAEYGMAGGISPEKVEGLLQIYPEIRAVILTSPTYGGIVSDILERLQDRALQRNCADCG